VTLNRGCRDSRTINLIEKPPAHFPHLAHLCAFETLLASVFSRLCLPFQRASANFLNAISTLVMLQIVMKDSDHQEARQISRPSNAQDSDSGSINILMIGRSQSENTIIHQPDMVTSDFQRSDLPEHAPVEVYCKASDYGAHGTQIGSCANAKYENSSW
jgi:hypothetical protein